MFKSVNGPEPQTADSLLKGLRSADVFIGVAPDYFFRESYDNFQQYANGLYSTLEICADTFGNRIWLRAGQIVGGIDYLQGLESFQDYSNGSYSSLSGGVGWLAAAAIFLVDYLQGLESFQDYSNGTYSSLSGGSGWLGDAVIFLPS